MHTKEKKRVCRCGCGPEQSPGKCDTPGWTLREEVVIALDEKRSRKLQMPRNHPFLNQTSGVALQSWRENCDVQFIIYEGDPMNPDLSEIAKLSDYIVACSAKGNCTWSEEIETMRDLINGCEEITSDKQDVKRAVKKVLNDTATRRVISKQEAMVLLGGMDLVQCTEIIETVSIKDSTKLTLTAESTGKKYKSIVKQHENRPLEDEALSLHAFFTKIKNQKSKTIIPNFAGPNSRACYPVSEA